MKTAISIPDPLFARVESRAAQLNMNRSEFFAAAATVYLEQTDRSQLTAALDDTLTRAGAHTTEEFRRLGVAGKARLAELTAGEEW